MIFCGGMLLNLSIFDVIGPIMIGPSSSHTAGAVKLAKIAQIIAGKPFTHVNFGLHGSFAKTGMGHGTELALLAGVLGIDKDDERIKHSRKIADAKGITYSFTHIELDDVHENTVVISFHYKDGGKTTVTGCSIGGGRIKITEINGVDVELSGEQPTLVIRQKDRPGVIKEVTQVLANNNINISVMRFSRVARHDVATSVIETDEYISDSVVRELGLLDDVFTIRVIQ